MKRYFLLLILSTLIIKTAAQINIDRPRRDIQDSILMSDIKNELESFTETINLINLAVSNHQLDSVLRSITEYKKRNNTSNYRIDSISKNMTTSKKLYYGASYYLLLTKKNDILYVSIADVRSHNDIIDFSNRDIPSDKFSRRIFGCVIYNNSCFYIISHSSPNDVKDEDLDCLFSQTNKEISIKKETIDDSIYFIEAPIQLYKYTTGKLILLNPSIP